MNNRNALVPMFAVAVIALAVVVGSIAIAADDARPAAAGAKQEMKLPPGWTEEEVKSCMAACTPGKMHEHLARGVGTWQGKSTMWMYPSAEPATSDCTSTVTPMMDGRFIKVEYAGEMPGMGPYNGFGIFGFDNVSQKFVSTWIDTCGTGMGNGTGELSADGKTLTITRTYNCPLSKKPVSMKEVETITGQNTKTLEITGSDPKSGKEFKMLSVEFTRK